jgi:hypothetical protein
MRVYERRTFKSETDNATVKVYQEGNLLYIAERNDPEKQVALLIDREAGDLALVKEAIAFIIASIEEA